MKYLNMILILAAALVPVSLFAEDASKSAAAETPSIIDSLMPEIHGQLETVLKKENSYRSPFDIPVWGWGMRAGDSNRNSQMLRTKGEIFFTKGDLGKSEFFGVFSLSVDANDPDNIKGYSAPKGLTTTQADIAEQNKNYETNKVEVTNAFVMWRPFEFGGGRPFGVSVGIQSIGETANAMYTHFFKGDIDQEFIAYTVTAFTQKPMINADFHIAEGTGIGYAFAKGASDFTQNSSGFSNEYSYSHIAYAEVKKFGVTGNAAYVYTRGNREPTDWAGTTYGSNWYDINGESGLGAYKTANDKYSSQAVNASLGYTVDLGKYAQIKPFVGYQRTWGDVAPGIAYQQSGLYAKQTNKAEVYTAGLEIKTDILPKTVTLAGEFSKVKTPSMSGYAGLDDGQIDVAAGTFSTGAFKGISGGAESTYTVVGLDWMGQLEATVDINKNFSLTVFAKHIQSQSVGSKVKGTRKQKEEIAKRILMSGGADEATADTYKGMVVDGTFGSSGAPGAATAQGAFNTLTTSLDKINQFGTEWTNCTSYGISANYKF